jgi:hypothetical protein
MVPDRDRQGQDPGGRRQDGAGLFPQGLAEGEFQDRRAVLEAAEVGLEEPEGQGRVYPLGVNSGKDNIRS